MTENSDMHAHRASGSGCSDSSLPLRRVQPSGRPGEGYRLQYPSLCARLPENP